MPNVLLLKFSYFLETQDQTNFCGTELLCNRTNFKDGVCDPQNNNRLCAYDGGDCCNYDNEGWDARCKDIGTPLVSSIGIFGIGVVASC